MDVVVFPSAARGSLWLLAGKVTVEEVDEKGTYSVWDLVICGRCLISQSLRHFTKPGLGFMQARYLFTKANAYSYDMPYFLMRYAITTEALREMPWERDEGRTTGKEGCKYTC